MCQYTFQYVTQKAQSSIFITVDAESKDDAAVELVNKIEGLRSQGVELPVNAHLWYIISRPKSDGVY